MSAVMHATTVVVIEPSIAHHEERHGAEGDVEDAQLHAARRSISASLQRRFPSISPVVLQQSIDRAIDTFSAARVRNFLPILIEREAAAALRAAHATPSSG